MASNKVDDWVEVQDTEDDDWEEVTEGPAAVPDMESDQTSMGFLGAEMPAPAEDSMPLGESAMGVAGGMMNTLAGIGSGLPVVGPLVDEAAKTELVSGRKGGMTDEQYSKLVEMGGSNREGGKAIGTMGGFMAAPGAVLPQLGLSAADMASRKMIGGQDISGPQAGGTLALEGALGASGKLLAKFKGLQDKMITQAGKQAEAAAGLSSSKSLRDKLAKMEASGKIKPGELGNRLIENGVVRAGDTAASVAKKSGVLIDNAGKEIDQLLSGKSVPTQKVQDALLNTLDKPAYTELREKVIKKVNTQVDLLEEAGENLDLTDLRKIKSEIGREVSDFQSKASSKEAGKHIYKGLTNAIENSLGERELNKLRELNKKFEVGRMAEEAASGTANSGMSGLRKMGVVTSTITGNTAVAGGLVAEHVFGKYKPALLAAGLTKASHLGKYAEKFATAAEEGPKAIGALHFQLLQDDKQYRKKHMKDKK